MNSAHSFTEGMDYIPEPKFKVGDYVELTGVYLNDKLFNQHSGKITEYFFSQQQVSLGASGHVYVIDGVGTYGQGALKKSETKI